MTGTMDAGNMRKGEMDKMKLYRMELYKLCHRKIVYAGTIFLTVVLLLFYSMKISEEWAYVDGVLYEGFEAIQKNREITEEFKGLLTDEKVDAIVEKYGFPQEVERNYGGFRDGNYLSAFVTDFLTDGYMRGWGEGEYQISTRTYPIAETELGAAKELTGQEIILEYSNGWSVFEELLNGGTILSSILIILIVSVLFAGERQAKMVPLLFTTKEGRQKDIRIKIAAAFTAAITIWLAVTALDLILCGYVYGYDGLDNLVGTTKIIGSIVAQGWSVSIWTVRHYIAVIIFRSFVGIMTLCATTIYISAGCRTSFHAVSIAAIVWGMPLLLWFLLPNGFVFSLVRVLIYATPLYHSMCNSIFDISTIWVILAEIAAVWSVFCVFRGYLKYRRQQAA